MLLRFLRNIEEILCVILLSTIVIVTTMQVISRYLLDLPNGWAEELVRFLFIWLVFFGASAGVKRKSHIKVEFFLERMSPLWKKITSITANVIVIGVLLLLIYQGTMLTTRMSTVSAISLPITWGYVYSAVPIGCLFILFRVIQHRSI